MRNSSYGAFIVRFEIRWGSRREIAGGSSRALTKRHPATQRNGNRAFPPCFRLSQQIPKGAHNQIPTKTHTKITTPLPFFLYSRAGGCGGARRGEQRNDTQQETYGKGTLGSRIIADQYLGACKKSSNQYYYCCTSFLVHTHLEHMLPHAREKGHPDNGNRHSFTVSSILVLRTK